ncbi:fimbrial protein (plasmid) [Klebsiella variicola subsp. variicola]|uniref:fimbrial protein n=1 Tax=Klebsiella variicola TaxID=244366 RepID=UPI0035A2DC47
MKKTIMSLAVVSALVSGVAFANPPKNDASKATVNFTGSVTASLCQVKTDNLTQTISLGEVSKSALKATGQGKPQSFQIGLTNCDTTTNTISYVLADGNYTPAVGATSIAYLVPKSGDNSAKGVGVFVETSDGTAVTPGSTTPNTIEVSKNGNEALSDQTISLRAYIATKDKQGADLDAQTPTVEAGTVDAVGVFTIKASA